MTRVAVITDSTADIPHDIAEDRGLRVVPMTVTFGEDSFISGVTMDPERFYERLEASDELPSTSQPAPAWFEEAYADAADHGADEVVSVHLSSELSGTVELARKVAVDAPLPVTVVDTRQTGGTLALAVFAALRAAERGDGADAVADVARAVAGDAQLFFVVDDLTYLKMGGRLSGAQAWVGSVLRVKPLLTIEDGRVVPLEKVRTWSRAITRLGELSSAHADGRPCDVIVTHALAPERAREVWEALGSGVEIRDRLDTVIGPVVGSHAGPGTVGVAVSARRD